MVGCEHCSRLAASGPLPSSATAMKLVSCCGATTAAKRLAARAPPSACEAVAAKASR